MAQKIIVISSFGDDSTGERLKRTVGLGLVRRGLADWVEKNKSLRRRQIREVQVFDKWGKVARRYESSKAYIPEEMPPAEVENVHCPEVKAVWPDPAPRMRNLPRYREVYGDAQLAASV